MESEKKRLISLLIHHVAKAYNSKRVYDYFIHAGHLKINGHKMAQSLGNFQTIHNFVEKYDANTLRAMFFLGPNWNQDVDITLQLVEQAVSFVCRIKMLLEEIKFKYKCNKSMNDNMKITDLIEETRSNVYTALSNNFNHSYATIILNNSFTRFNTILTSECVSHKNLDSIISFIHEINNIIGIEFESMIITDEERFISEIVKIRTEIRTLAMCNGEADRKKLFELANKIRDTVISSLGWKLDDTSQGDKFYRR